MPFDKDKNQNTLLLKQGFLVPGNNLNRETSVLWSRKPNSNNTIDIFKAVEGEDSENIKKAVISEHLTLIAPKTYYMAAKHEKPYSFLMEKIAQNVNSRTPRMDQTSKGLTITFSRTEWDMRTEETNKKRAFEELYLSLIEISKLIFYYGIYKNGKREKTITGAYIYNDGIEFIDGKTIKAVVPPNTVNLFIDEALQRAVLDVHFYTENENDNFITPFLALIALELNARRNGVLVISVKDLVKKLSINDTDRRKARYVITPVKRMVEKAEKHGYKIEYLTQANTPPKGYDLMDYNNFVNLRLRITQNNEDE